MIEKDEKQTLLATNDRNTAAGNSSNATKQHLLNKRSSYNTLSRVSSKDSSSTTQQEEDIQIKCNSLDNESTSSTSVDPNINLTMTTIW